MSDEHAVPPEGPDTFLSGSEPIDGDGDDDLAAGSSQALLPSDLEEPALLNGTSGGAEGESAGED